MGIIDPSLIYRISFLCVGSYLVSCYLSSSLNMPIPLTCFRIFPNLLSFVLLSSELHSNLSVIHFQLRNKYWTQLSSWGPKTLVGLNNYLSFHLCSPYQYAPKQCLVFHTAPSYCWHNQSFIRAYISIPMEQSFVQFTFAFIESLFIDFSTTSYLSRWLFVILTSNLPPTAYKSPCS